MLFILVSCEKPHLLPRPLSTTHDCTVQTYYGHIYCRSRDCCYKLPGSLLWYSTTKWAKGIHILCPGQLFAVYINEREREIMCECVWCVHVCVCVCVCVCVRERTSLCVWLFFFLQVIGLVYRPYVVVSDVNNSGTVDVSVCVCVYASVCVRFGLFSRIWTNSY